MDHVQNNNSMEGNENYAHELGQQMNNYLVDPSIIDQSQWVQPTAQYTEDIFNSQQGYQQHQHQQHHPQHHPQQQYLQPAPSAYSYDATQSPIYSNAPYQHIYGQQDLRSNNINQYGVQYGGYPNSSQSPMQSVPHPSHQQYATSQMPYSYPTQGQVPATISPHDLERAASSYSAPLPVTNTLAPQTIPSNNGNEFFRRTWTSEPEFQEQPIAVSAPAPQYGVSDTVQVASRPTVSHHAVVPSIAAVPTIPTAAASQPEPTNQTLPSSLPAPSVSEVAQKYALAQLRITDPDLLAETEGISARRLPNAPYAVIGTGTIELDAKYSSKALPVWQGRPNRSGKILVPGLENKISSTPITKPKKPRAPRARKHASAASNLLKQEQPRPLPPNIAIGGENDNLGPSIPPAESSSEEEYTSSEDESDYTDEEEEVGDLRTLEEIRPGPRPSDVAEGSSWDAIGIIYTPPGRRPTSEEKVKVAMEFHPFVTTLREELVRVSADLAKAEAEKRDADAKTLKSERSARQQALVNALNAVITKGHQDVKDTLATHDKFVVGLTNILRNCIKADDYLGDLALGVFHLMSTFTKASEALLTRSKFEGIVKKFSRNRLESKNVDPEGKRKQEDIKRFVESIMKNTVEAQDRAAAAAAEASPKKGEQKDILVPKAVDKDIKPTAPTDSKTGMQSGSGLKRPHEPDTNINVPNKKVVSEGIKATAIKPPGAKIPIKPGSFFAKLGKQAPKPSPSAANAAPAAKPPVKRAAPVSTGPSTLSMLLADIQKPKEIPKPPEAPKRPDETPEERARRERKESRRHLRVHFKEGDELTQVRIFKHERSEDEGRDGDMLRDAHDDRSEGMMHKQRFQGTADVDDDEGETDINEKPWPSLSQIDFSDLSEGRYGKAFTTRGGQVSFETPQQNIQAQREDTELMVVYTDVKDIPASPKEAPVEPTTPDIEILLRQPTNFPKVQARLLYLRLFGSNKAISTFIRDAEEEKLGIHKEMQQRRANEILGLTGYPSVATMIKAIAESSRFENQYSQYQPPPPEKSLEQQLTILAQLQSGIPVSTLFPSTVQQPQVQTSSYCPPGMDPVVMANLDRVFSNKIGLPYPATEAPDWMTPNGKRQWYEYLLRDQISKAAGDKAKSDNAIADLQPKLQPTTDDALLSQLQRIMTSQQAVPQQAQPQMAIPGFAFPPPANGSAAPTSSLDPNDLQKVLASLGYSGQNNAAQNQVQTQQEQWAAWAAQASANYNQNPYQQSQPSSWQPQQKAQTPAWQPSAYGQQAQQSSWQMPNQSDTTQGGQERTDNSNNQSWENPNSKYNKNRHDPDYKRGTKPCRFWSEGKCAKGANCTFIHE